MNDVGNIFEILRDISISGLLGALVYFLWKKNDKLEIKNDELQQTYSKRIEDLQEKHSEKLDKNHSSILGIKDKHNEDMASLVQQSFSLSTSFKESLKGLNIEEKNKKLDSIEGAINILSQEIKSLRGDGK